MAETIPVKVKILEKDYRIACPENEQNSLLASADLLNSKMKEFRDSGKAIDTDTIAVMAALNLTHELLENSNVSVTTTGSITKRINVMQDDIESALQDAKQMEI